MYARVLGACRTRVECVLGAGYKVCVTCGVRSCEVCVTCGVCAVWFASPRCRKTVSVAFVCC